MNIFPSETAGDSIPTSFLREPLGSRRNKFAFCCRPPGPLARRERRCVPGAVREERATKPAGLRAAARSGALLSMVGEQKRFMIDHRLSRQNVKLFLREPLDTVNRDGLQAQKDLAVFASQRWPLLLTTETRHGISNTDRCAEGASPGDEYQIVQSISNGLEDYRFPFPANIGSHFRSVAQFGSYQVFKRYQLDEEQVRRQVRKHSMLICVGRRRTLAAATRIHLREFQEPPGWHD